MNYWSTQLEGKGVSIEILRWSEKCALIYVYRENMVYRDLKKPETVKFLKEYGYENLDMQSALSKLKERLTSQKVFPHEIGVFLGYPLEDVIAFIKNNGKNSKCTGCWKVYCNQQQAQEKFALFKRCRKVYVDLWQKGISVQQLTAAA